MPGLVLAAWLLAGAILAGLTAAVVVHLRTPATDTSMAGMAGMGGPVSRALYRAGGDPHGPLLSSRLLTVWQLDAVALAVLVLLAAGYLTGVSLARRAGRRPLAGAVHAVVPGRPAGVWAGHQLQHRRL